MLRCAGPRAAFLVIAAASFATAQQTATLDAAPVAGSPATPLFEGMDGYARQVTTDSPQAQAYFDQGIQFLFGFNHEQAIRSFQQAAQLDPSCAMAWWGVGYANGLHINNIEMTPEQNEQAYQAAQRALKELDDETAAERALVEALSERYAWPAPEDRVPLDQAYADAMEAAWHAHPDDPDIAALYAEALMDLQPWDLWTPEGVPKGRTLEIVAVLESLLRNTPRHPGGNHFYIHAIEASPWPEKGAAAAESLVALVPGAGHLVHMPSHIYIRTGQYEAASAANERAAAADEKHFAVAGPPGFYGLYYMHNLHFLAYASMMEGRQAAALAAARKLEARMPDALLENFAPLADGFMPTALHVMIRFGMWDEIIAEPEPPEWRLSSRAIRHYARTVALANLGQIDKARAELEDLDDVAAQLTDEWFVGNNAAADVVAVSRLMAEGELEYHAGNVERAFDLLRQAVAAEELLSYDEPPGWMQPVRHALGALLMAEGRAVEAEAVYRADLAEHPNNAWSLLGLRQSLQTQKKAKAAEAVAMEVDAAWARADVEPAASCYCHPDAKDKSQD